MSSHAPSPQPKPVHPNEAGWVSTPGALPHSASSASIEPDAARVSGLEVELAEMRERWMRAQAEIANVRSRSRRDIDEARQFAIQKFAIDVVGMADNLQRGIANLPPKADGEAEIVTRLRDGFTGLERSFVGQLGRNGITRHDPTGEVFDPGVHQAMDQRASADHAPGTVLQASTPAWLLNGRLLRPAMVVVSTAPQGPHTPGG